MDQLRFAPAAEVRARGQRRRTQRRVIVGTTTAAVLMIGAGAGLTRTTGGPATVAAAPACSALLDLALPDDPSRVTVQVTDGSPELFAELRSRKFTVLDSSTVRVPIEPVTYLRYGPAAVGAATVLRATISGEVDMRFDPDRIGTTIDLVVGQGAFGPATTTEMNQALVEPTRPPECR